METAGKKAMDEDLLITAYMGILPSRLQEAVYNLENDVTNLKELQTYVCKQVNAHMDQSFGDKGLLEMDKDAPQDENKTDQDEENFEPHLRQIYAY